MNGSRFQFLCIMIEFDDSSARNLRFLWDIQQKMCTDENSRCVSSYWQKNLPLQGKSEVETIQSWYTCKVWVAISKNLRQYSSYTYFTLPYACMLESSDKHYVIGLLVNDIDFILEKDLQKDYFLTKYDKFFSSC